MKKKISLVAFPLITTICFLVVFTSLTIVLFLTESICVGFIDVILLIIGIFFAMNFFVIDIVNIIKKKYKIISIYSIIYFICGLLLVLPCVLIIVT